MARYLALEWDSREARIALAKSRATDVVIEQAFAIDLQARGEESASEAEIGARIAAALQKLDPGKGELLVSVGRASTELRMLSLPPSPPEEWPELVRFQALRQFTAIDEKWALDFVPLETAEDGSATVLAAAVAPKVLEQIQRVCQQAGFTPNRIILRPFAAASLLRRLQPDTTDDCLLLVDLLADEADLTVLNDGHVVFVRTVRLSSLENLEAQAQALVGEIRRTMAAAQNQLSGRRVERVAIGGDGDDHAALRAAIIEQLGLSVDLFDPLEQVKTSRALRSNRPQHSGRFMPLLGMLLDEANDTPHAIDFLHPRKKPEPPDYRRRNLLAAAALTLLVAAGGFFLWMELRRLDAEIRDLQAQTKRMDAGVKAAAKKEQDLAKVEDFVRGDITWVNELRELSLELPPADDALVTNLHAMATVEGGQMIVNGYVREPSIILTMEQNLRDALHRVKGGGGSEKNDRPRYPWLFQETIYVSRPEQVPERDRGDASPESSNERNEENASPAKGQEEPPGPVTQQEPAARGGQPS